MNTDCNRCSHSASLHWASQELGRDEVMDECHAEGCSCGNYEGPKDIDSAGEGSPDTAFRGLTGISQGAGNPDSAVSERTEPGDPHFQGGEPTAIKRGQGLSTRPATGEERGGPETPPYISDGERLDQWARAMILGGVAVSAAYMLYGPPPDGVTERVHEMLDPEPIAAADAAEADAQKYAKRRREQ